MHHLLINSGFTDTSCRTVFSGLKKWGGVCRDTVLSVQKSFNL